MIDLDKLETIAKAATPGPWACEHNDRLDRHFVNRMIDSNIICECEEWAEKSIKGYVNAAFIAAANPDVVLKLIAELREARRERNWLASQRYPQGPGDTSGCPNLERYSKCDNVGSYGVHSHKRCRECWLNAATKRKIKR